LGWAGFSKNKGHSWRSMEANEWVLQRVGRIRADDVYVVGLEVEIVIRLTPTGWRSDCEDPRVEGDPEVEEQAEQRVLLDDQVLKEGSELLRLTLACERSPRSQVTG